MKTCSECCAGCCLDVQLELNKAQIAKFYESGKNILNSQRKLVSAELIQSLEENQIDMYTAIGYCPFVTSNFQCGIFNEQWKPVECGKYKMNGIFCNVQFIKKDPNEIYEK